MENREQALGSELQSPEISSSGIPMGLELERELFSPPEHWWVPRSSVPVEGRKRRREEEEEKEEEQEGDDNDDENSRPGIFEILVRQLFSGEEQEQEEEEGEEEEERDDNEEDNSRPGVFEILDHELFSGEEQQEDEEGPRRPLRKRRRLQHRGGLPEYHIAFVRLLTDPLVKSFLAWDQHLEVSDKYQLAKVVVYFKRFGLFGWELRPIHFFLALYIANNMEEEHQEARETIYDLLYGSSRLQVPQFHRQRLKLLHSMHWWTMVSRDECEKIQAFDPDLWVWNRDSRQLT